MSGPETKPYEKQLKEPGVFSLGTRRLTGLRITVFTYFKGYHAEDKTQYLLAALEDNTRADF